jgi:hypothetical protein
MNKPIVVGGAERVKARECVCVYLSRKMSRVSALFLRAVKQCINVAALGLVERA